MLTTISGLAARAARMGEALFGSDLSAAEGVLHVTATSRGPSGNLHVLAIGPEAPKSEHDFFVLNLCRARCDALLTTAENLRSEPGLQHDLQGPHAEALAHYRSELLHKTSPPTCAILTRSGSLPLVHPTWTDSTHKVVLTESEEMASRLAAQLGARAEVVALSGLTARRALAWLAQRGAATISVETGPRTAGALYEPPSGVDELLLSRFEPARDLAPRLLGGSLPEDARLLAGKVCVAESVRDEPSGRWRFQRWLRAPSG